jgi:dolichyl-phosphate-mannose--protein O-mannosyl transferase
LGFSVGYLPWLLYPNRTVFQFYSIVFLPFLVLAIVHLTQRYVRGSADQESTKRYVVGAAIFALAVSLFFLPIWNGTWIPYWFWQIHMWLPTWI